MERAWGQLEEALRKVFAWRKDEALSPQRGEAHTSFVGFVPFGCSAVLSSSSYREVWGFLGSHVERTPHTLQRTPGHENSWGVG